MITSAFYAICFFFQAEDGIRDGHVTGVQTCALPILPGDDIVGFITRGRGVSVHRTDCPNVSAGEEDRLIDVEWDVHYEEHKSYSVDLEISGFDRNGLLNDILQKINDTNTHITAVTGKTSRNKIATVNITILIHNVDHLQRIVDRVKQVKDVFAVQRTIH